MIWGMTLEPGKLYTETMGEEVQLSMAAIDSRKDLGAAGDGSDRSFSQIVMQTSKGEYVLCTLVHGVMFQQNLDLKIMPREKVTFSVQGSSVVYLVGYTAAYPEDEFGEMGEDASDGSSAWEAFEPEEYEVDQVKQEPVEIPEDQSTQEGEYPTEQDGESPTHQEGESPSQHQQQEQGEEIIFPISDPESNVKLEAHDPDPIAEAGVHPHEAVYNMPGTDGNGAVPQQPSNEDYFYPETQHQPEVPPTPIPDAYHQPLNSAISFPREDPQGGMAPVPEQFLPPQRSPMQRSQAGPIRHPVRRGGTMPSGHTQRNYQPQRQRRQYGNATRSPPTRKTKSVPQPMNVQHQQQSMPGPSQHDVPGPSNSGFHATSYQTHHWVLEGYPTSQNPGRIEPFSAREFVGGVSGSLPTTRERNPGTSRPPTAGSKRNGTSLEHLPSEGSPAYCRFCAKEFRDLAKLKSHEANHARVVRYHCEFCGKSFYNKSHQVEHERIHTGEKPYQCRFCGRRFTHRGNCRTHEGSVHRSENVN